MYSPTKAVQMYSPLQRTSAQPRQQAPASRSSCRRKPPHIAPLADATVLACHVLGCRVPHTVEGIKHKLLEAAPSTWHKRAAMQHCADRRCTECAQHTSDQQQLGTVHKIQQIQSGVWQLSSHQQGVQNSVWDCRETVHTMCIIAGYSSKPCHAAQPQTWR
jgi:hypothetical protein